MWTRRGLALALVGLAASWGGSGYALAGDCDRPGSGYSSGYGVRYVTVYETVEMPYVYYVTKYDHCGHPYRVKVVAVKKVRVAVQKPVRVGY